MLSARSSEAHPGPVPLSDRAVLAAFALSGASGLVYEVVWLRWLVNVFGATTLAVSTILAAFMAGLALGSWAAGRLAARTRHPLRAYGLLELAIGAYALALPTLLGAVDPALRALGATDEASFVALSLARLGLATALLVVPTACMGATLPLLCELLAPGGTRVGTDAGRLYAANTVGAVLGAAGAGFALLPALGALATNRLAVALNVLVGGAVLALGSRRRVATVPSPVGAGITPALRPAPASEAPPRQGAGRREAVVALAVVAASGALAMVYEVAWTRALALVLGSSTYAFSVMLTTFLAGLAGGSYLLARRVDRLAEPAPVLASVQVLTALTALAGVAAVGALPYVFVRLFALSRGRHGLLLALEFPIAATLLLGPALLSGAVFPLCVRLVAAARASAGRAAGDVYAANTCGAIAGSFAGGFVLIPLVGIRGALLLAILLNLACAFALAVATPWRRRAGAWAMGLATPALALAVPFVAPEWNPLTMSAGVAVYAPALRGLSLGEFRQQRGQAHLLFYEEGLTTTVSVEGLRRSVNLRVNGKADASSADADMRTQVLLAHLPLLLHAAPRDVALIGLGSGVTAGSLLRHPVRTVTIVELEPAVVRASRFFDSVSGRPLADPRARLVVNDARSFFRLTRARFDVIVSEPSNPWISGAATLFTRDFFEQGRERLRPGGLFGQWVQLYGMSPELLRTLLATFRAVFPHAALFETAFGDTILVGSAAPLRLGLPFLERTTEPAIAADLARIRVAGPADLLARLLLDGEDVGRLAAGAPLNTDDNARIEFAAPRTLYADTIAGNAQLLADAFSGQPLLRELAAVAPPQLLVDVGRRLVEWDRPQQAEVLARLPTSPARAALLAVSARAAAARGDHEEARRRWQAVLALDPDHPEALRGLAAGLEDRARPAEALPLLRRARLRGDIEGAIEEADLLCRTGACRQAEALLARLPADRPEVALAMGRVQLALGRAHAAERHLREGLARRQDARARAALGTALDQLGQPAAARLERQQAAELEQAEARRLLGLARLRARSGHVRWAADALRRATALWPTSREPAEERARLLEGLPDREAAIAAWEELARRFPDHTAALLRIAALAAAAQQPARARAALGRYLDAEPAPWRRREAEEMLARLPREGGGVAPVAPARPGKASASPAP